MPSSHVRCVIEALAGIAGAEDGRYRDGCAEFGREARALSLRSGARVVVLSKQHIACSSFIVPRMPACAVDHGAHSGVLEDDSGPLSPRPAEVVGAGRHRLPRGCCYVAVVEDIVGWI